MKPNLLNLNETELIAQLQAWQEPPYRAKQIIQWVHQYGITDFQAMSNLSQSLREQLAHHYTISLPDIAAKQLSSDGTQKWLLALADDHKIEMVYIPDKKRGTLCLSSQVGCPLQCHFCATGKMGFLRNLTLGEIIGQLRLAVTELAPQGLKKNRAISNVVMMGMGEPLLNYDAVVAAIGLMLDDYGYGLSKYRITLSTAGVVPALEKLKYDSPCALAISLHAPNNELRNQIMPINRRYSLEQLMAVCRGYFPQESKRTITFEYILIDHFNDQSNHAKALIKLLHGVAAKVNLIPVNPMVERCYQPSTPATTAAFQQQLTAAGINTRLRKPRGQDIAAACGQLYQAVDQS